MPVVKCTRFECKHSKNGVCTASVISLSCGRMHTVWEGAQNVWRCGCFEMSEEAKRAYELLAKIMGGDGK